MATDKLNALLLQYDVNVLKAIAREHGLDTKNQTKPTIADMLAKRIAQREHVERVLPKLNPAEREILTLIQRAGGEAAVGACKSMLLHNMLFAHPSPRKNQWGIVEPEPEQGNPRYSGKPTFKDAAARLLQLGLVLSRESTFASKTTIAWDLGRYFVIPKEIRPFLPPPPTAQAPTVAEPKRVEPGSSRNFQRDLSRYWSVVRRAGNLQLTSQGYVYKKQLVEIAKSLGWAETKKLDEKNNLYLYFVRRMLVALGLLQPEKYNGIPLPEASNYFPDEGQAFWSRPPAERVQQAFEAYLDATTWNELRIPKAAYGQDHRRPAPEELKPARRVVVEHLKRRGPSGWVNLSDLLDDIRLGDYEFLFPRRANRSNWYGYGPAYSSPYYQSNNPFSITFGDVGDEAAGWGKVEGAIVTHMIAGPLHWLGLVDLGFDEKDGDTPRAYRLTAMGAWVLGIGAPVTIAEEGGRVVVQPNFQIVAMEPIAESVLMTLDEFTQFEGGDHALSYRLTRESVYRGQRANWSAARIIAHLEQITHAPLPQNVRRSLEEWQALHERITFRRGVPLLQAEDSKTLDELFANPALSAKLGRPVGDHVALPDKSAHEVAQALREAGWLPVVTRRGQTDAPASLVADEEGNITLLHRAPSVYAYQGVEAFAERVDTRHARITPATVAAATKQNLSVPAMLAQLKSVHRGDIPPKLVMRLKAWGKYFGAARLGTLTLIEFRDEKARAELLADPELKKFISRFDAGERPLALVRSDALARVQELLAERGVEIQAFE
ncbi:MAG: helicase-associated domain-containing protein [Chloroflexi bacterium]|nr:helicase-associated domain-containing protein [Chloroflexota bacterium]